MGQSSVKFITIRSWMKEKLDLRGSALLVYATIYSLSQGGGKCTVGNEEICDFWGFSARTVQRAREELEKNGLIRKTAGGWIASPVDGIFKKSGKMTERQNDASDKTSSERDEMSSRSDKMTPINKYKLIYKYTHSFENEGEEKLDAIEKWLDYLSRTGNEPNAPSGEAFIERALQYIDRFGIEKFNEVADYSIINGYRHFYWDRFEEKSEKKAAPSQQNDKRKNGVLPPSFSFGGAKREKESVFSSDASYDLKAYMLQGLVFPKKGEEKGGG